MTLFLLYQMHNDMTVPSSVSRLKKIGDLKPKQFNAEQSLVNIGQINGLPYPVLITPRLADVNINEWVKNNAAETGKLLQTHGAILFRDFDVHSVDAFESFMQALSGDIMEYTNRSSPRHAVQNNIYTSTDHPNDQMINMHNEHSYSHQWPLKIVFYCLMPGHQGGETPIADSRKVLAALSKDTIDKFVEKQVMYIRQIGTGLGMSWQDVFQTNDKKVVEEHCRKYGVEFSWISDSKLKLTFVRAAVRLHPKTNEPVWFNHAFFFNILGLDKSIRDTLLEQKSDEIMPFQTFYGDGSLIEEETIEEIRAVYEKTKISFAWQKGDILVLDNMLMAHGRNAYQGERKILVGMAEPFSI